MIDFMAADPHIGTRIKKRRQVLRMSQGDLAVKLGVSKSTVANWERGKHFPLRHLGAVEEVLGISLDDEAAAGPLDDLRPLDEWEAEVAARPSMLDDDKRWAIISSRAARAEDVRRRRERAAGERESARSGLGTGAA
jgi:transcriptional regulator with XRE-family HTH domain